MLYEEELEEPYGYDPVKAGQFQERIKGIRLPLTLERESLDSDRTEEFKFDDFSEPASSILPQNYFQASAERGEEDSIH